MSEQNKETDERFNPFMARPNKQSHLRYTYAIVSGKGGVGKSTVTALLASSLNHKGYSVGILDADITGPSQAHAFNIHSKAAGSDIGIIPAYSREGVKIISANMLLEDEEAPVLWRGPMIANAVKEFYTNVVWGDTDFLLIDMPPGTGDVALSVFQSIHLDGIIIVTSPQEMVSMIVTKAVKMAEQMNIKVLGLIENMSYLDCDHCGERIYPFGEGRIEAYAQSLNLTVLAQLPIRPEIARYMDEGRIEEIVSKPLDTLSSQLIFDGEVDG